jgi:HEAT repeat protein
VPNSFLTSIVKRVRQFLFALRERPAIKVDEFEFEHLLVYHDLIGSSFENRAQVKAVKADIIAALEASSRASMGIALKLPPLVWEDQLRGIFLELPAQQKTVAIELLMPDQNDLTASPDSSLIRHSDWRVRANTANLLAVLKVQAAAQPLAEALNDTTDSGHMAFCHIAYALGKLQTEESRIALSEHIDNPVAWLRVDVARALSLFPFQVIGHTLAQLLGCERDMLDYMSVAILRQQPLERFITAKDDKLVDAGCALVIGMIEAANQSFGAEVVLSNNAPSHLQELVERAIATASPVRISAALSLSNWLSSHESTISKGNDDSTASKTFATTLEHHRSRLCSEDLRERLLADLGKQIGQSEKDDQQALTTLRYSIMLAGQLRLLAAEPLLISVLKPGFPLVNEVVEALGLIGVDSSSEALLRLAKEIVDVDARQQLPKSKQPVLEADADKAKTYWTILKALANFSSLQSAQFLLAATEDYAPDKRAQALASLIDAAAEAQNQNQPHIGQKKLEDHLITGLSDPSALVQLAALEGAGKLAKSSLIEPVARLVDAQENTVSKHALFTLSKLSSAGHEHQVREVLTKKLKTEREREKKQHIQQLLGHDIQDPVATIKPAK